ncbi:MAG: ABC transporter permease [Chloroflexota bacterium]|nr:ABC transporter permease [Chloroflexota bacterium]
MARVESEPQIAAHTTWMRRARETRIALGRWPVLPLAILAILVAVAAFGPLLAPYDPTTGDLGSRLAHPFTPGYLLGTDHAGRDILSRLIYGARISLIVAMVSVTIGFFVGTAIGVVSGYFGGVVDEFLMRVVDIWYSLPFLMVALVVVLILGQSFNVLLALLAVLAWAPAVRVVRGQTLQLKEMDFVALARIAGASPVRLMFRHLFPGVLNSAVVIATLQVGHLIVAEATLSFLGAGIPPPTPSWGVMVSEGRDYIATAWWVAFFPGAAIFLVVVAFNFLGDWLRDKLDPRLRQL